MTRLMEALERVATSLEPDVAPRVRGHQDQIRPLAASTLMLTIPGIGEILRENFAEVPADQVEIAGDDVTTTCSCGRDLTLAFGALVRCSCWRFYFNGKTLKVSTQPAPTDVVLCDHCDDELVFKDGDWIRVAGADLYVCAPCHADLVASADVDLFGGAA